MHDSIRESSLVCISASYAGGVIALGLRDEWTAMFLPAFLGAIIIASYCMIVLPVNIAVQFLLALSFYGVAFQGLLGPLDGSFGAIWFLLTIAFSAFQIGFVYSSTFAVSNIPTRAISFPFAIVAGEFLRHWVTRLYDGSGLTFCLLGQATANSDLLIQNADWGGVWLLSFVVAMIAAAITTNFIPGFSRQNRVFFAGVATAILFVLFSYGAWRLSNQNVENDSAKMNILVCPHIPDVRLITELKTASEQLAVLSSYKSVVLFPETCIGWSFDTSKAEPQQLLLTNFSRLVDFTFVLGVWIRTNDERSRNACLILENGVVSESIDKMHLVPFVESRPIGTEQLLKAGLIPAAAVRNIVVGESVNYTSWENGDMRVVPCVCYDLFFSETFQRFPQRTKSINVCCLDETFDGNGVFRKLSRIHSRLRAVEFRQPVVRSSLGGFSGAFDQRGTSIEATEVHDKFSWFEVQPTNITTVYEEFGDWFPVFCCVVCSIFGIVSPFSSQNPQGKPQ